MYAGSRYRWFASITAGLILALGTCAAVELPVEAGVTSDGNVPQPGLSADVTAPGAISGAAAQHDPRRCELCGRTFVPLPRPAWQPLTDTGVAQSAVPPVDGTPQGPDETRAAAALPGNASPRTASPLTASAYLLGTVSGPEGMSHDAARGTACACEGRAVGDAATPSHPLTAGRTDETLGLWKTWRAYAGDGDSDLGALFDHARGAVRPLEALAALSAVAHSLVRHRSGTEALRTLVRRAPMLRPRHAPRRCPVCAALATLAGDAWRAPDHGPRQPARGGAGLTH